MSALQIRDVPDEVHRTLKARAIANRQSLSEYALSVLVREAAQPTIADLLDRARLRGPVDVGTAGVEILREERESSR